MTTTKFIQKQILKLSKKKGYIFLLDNSVYVTSVKENTFNCLFDFVRKIWKITDDNVIYNLHLAFKVKYIFGVLQKHDRLTVVDALTLKKIEFPKYKKSILEYVRTTNCVNIYDDFDIIFSFFPIPTKKYFIIFKIDKPCIDYCISDNIIKVVNNCWGFYTDSSMDIITAKLVYENATCIDTSN